MKLIIVGIGIFLFGLILATLGAGIFDSGNPDYSYYYAIVFSILYLCAVVGISTSLILKEIRKEKNN